MCTIVKDILRVTGLRRTLALARRFPDLLTSRKGSDCVFVVPPVDADVGLDVTLPEDVTLAVDDDPVLDVSARAVVDGTVDVKLLVGKEDVRDGVLLLVGIVVYVLPVVVGERLVDVVVVDDETVVVRGLVLVVTTLIVLVRVEVDGIFVLVFGVRDVLEEDDLVGVIDGFVVGDAVVGRRTTFGTEKKVKFL
ncbi:hypothetical protein Aduo_019835 [Ancylostoma duodenale]